MKKLRISRVHIKASRLPGVISWCKMHVKMYSVTRRNEAISVYSSILMSNSSRHVLINHLSSALEYFDATLHVPINCTSLLDNISSSGQKSL